MILILIRAIYIPLVLSVLLLVPALPVIRILFKKSYKKRLVLALEMCGPVFIKCGQSISLKPYLFRAETIEACTGLQDRVSSPRMNLLKEMGEDIKDFIFSSYKPIASGSIASVFKATHIETGQEVAIKVLKPNVIKIIKADIALLKAGSFFLQAIPVFKRLKIKGVVRNIESTLISETNFKTEAENIFKIKSNCIHIHKKIKLPRVFAQYTKSNILVTEFIKGFALSDIPAIKNAGLETRKIAANLIEVYLHQVYEHGLFHADFHPGNIFVNKNYTIILIDFGIVSTISYKDRVVIAKILNGFLAKDYNEVLNAHLEGGYILESANLPEFKKDLERIGDMFIHSGGAVKFSISGILMELFRIMEKYKIEVKEDLLLLYKTIFFVEAVVNKLEPGYNIWATIKPWMISWKRRNLGLRAKLEAILINMVREAARIIKKY